MPLTETAIKKAKPGPKPVKLSDGKGLYLLVNPVGSKLWRWKYRVLGPDGHPNSPGCGHFKLLHLN
jgi:hypothetical protein